MTVVSASKGSAAALRARRTVGFGAAAFGVRRVVVAFAEALAGILRVLVLALAAGFVADLRAVVVVFATAFRPVVAGRPTRRGLVALVAVLREAVVFAAARPVVPARFAVALGAARVVFGATLRVADFAAARVPTFFGAAFTADARVVFAPVFPVPFVPVFATDFVDFAAGFAAGLRPAGFAAVARVPARRVVARIASERAGLRTCPVSSLLTLRTSLTVVLETPACALSCNRSGDLRTPRVMVGDDAARSVACALRGR